MQKNLLQPLPASASPFLVFQCLFCFSPLFCFNASFLLQRLFSFLFLFFSFGAPFFCSLFFFSSWLFSFSTSLFVLFLAQNLLQPKKPTQSLQFVRASLSRWSQTACLKTKRDPLFMPILKPKKKSSFSLHSSKTQYSF